MRLISNKFYGSSFILILLSIVLGCTSNSEKTAVEDASKPPNIILINADDLGYGDLSSYGASLLKTPNIDQLAKEGRRFTDAHSASAVCTPSRYALMTAEYPIRTGNLRSPVFLKNKLVIDTQKETLASLLKKAGYATACIGKWHLGFGDKEPTDWNAPLSPGPNELGFDYYYGVPVVNSHPPFVYVENHKVVGYTEDDPFIYGQRSITKEVFEKNRLDDIGGADQAHALYVDEEVGTHLTHKAIRWMKQQKNQPFFLYLATTNIHHPFTPAPQFLGTSQCGIYGDFVHELDWMVGQVMDMVKEMGQENNTLVVFTSDNGGMFNATGQKTYQQGHKLNGDLLGFKFDAWEGGHRVPFIVHWRGKIKAGEVSDQLICNVDLLATFAALTGQTLAEGQARDSKDMLGAIMGTTDEQLRDEALLAPHKWSHLALRRGKWMFIGAQGAGGFTGRKHGAHAFGGPAAISYAGQKNSDIVDGKIKEDAPPAQLYDLEIDPNQTHNLYAKHPDVVATMNNRLTYLKENLLRQ